MGYGDGEELNADGEG